MDNSEFTPNETKSFKSLLEVYFKDKGFFFYFFVEFCERILLAKRYVARRSGRYVAKPIDYLNIHFKFGIAGTEDWYKQLEQQRKLVPQYTKALRGLPKAF